MLFLLNLTWFIIKEEIVINNMGIPKKWIISDIVPNVETYAGLNCKQRYFTSTMYRTMSRYGSPDMLHCGIKGIKHTQPRAT